MKTTFVPKPEQKPALPKFGDLVVGQGFRFEAGGPIFIKIDETPHRQNCVAVDTWQAYGSDGAAKVVPVDLELREL